MLSQNPAIKIEIDSITSSDSIVFRKFIVTYHIENLTNRELTFFFSPNTILSNMNAAMSLNPSYKLFENNQSIDANVLETNKLWMDYNNELKNARNWQEKKEIRNKEAYKKWTLSTDSINSAIQKEFDNPNLLWKRKNKRLLDAIYTLHPNEVKKYTQPFYWDKTRYFKINEYQYYINEKEPHFIEISMVLWKEENKENLSPDEYEKMMKNNDFLKGWFTSNKVAIDFRE